VSWLRKFSVGSKNVMGRVEFPSISPFPSLTRVLGRSSSACLGQICLRAPEALRMEGRPRAAWGRYPREGEFSAEVRGVRKGLRRRCLGQNLLVLRSGSGPEEKVPGIFRSLSLDSTGRLRPNPYDVILRLLS